MRWIDPCFIIFGQSVVHLLRRWLLAPEVPEVAEAAETFWTRCDAWKERNFHGILIQLDHFFFLDYFLGVWDELPNQNQDFHSTNGRSKIHSDISSSMPNFLCLQ